MKLFRLALLTALTATVGCHSGPPTVGVSRWQSFAPVTGMYSAALSPDGRTVALLSRLNPGFAPRDLLVLDDVASRNERARMELPRVKYQDPSVPSQGKDPDAALNMWVRPRLAWCDGGRALLAQNGGDSVYVIDPAQMTVQQRVVLGDLSIPSTKGSPAVPLRKGSGFLHARMACAAEEKIAMLAFSEYPASSIKLLNLESGAELPDLGNVPLGEQVRYQGGDIALSPDGALAAVVVWDLASEADVAEVIDTRSRAVLAKVELSHALNQSVYRLAFTGNQALAVAEIRCEPNGSCREENDRSAHSVRVWDLASGQMKELTEGGQKTWRYAAGVADGRLVMTYEGAEHFCAKCNEGVGEIKVDDPRFAVWDWRSGKVVARSPKLRLQEHTCPWLHIGSCTERMDVPDLQMSADGRTVLEFAPATDAPWEKKEKAPGVFEVFSLSANGR